MIIRQKRMLLLGIAVVLVVGLSLTGVIALIRSHQTVNGASRPQVAGQQSLASEKMSVAYTFEDGGTDGWIGKGHIISVANNTTQAHDGTHSLMITLYSSSPSDLPFVSVPVGSGGPVTGEILTAYLHLAGSTKVQAQLYVQDSNYQWHLNSLLSLASGRWTKLTLTMPTLDSSLNALGIQFLVTPANTDATIYLDSISWGLPGGSTPVSKPSGSGGGSPTSTTSNSSGKTPTPQPSHPAPQPTPTPTLQPASSLDFSFEDGGLDGWSANGHIPGLTNSTAAAYDGSHALKVTVYSASAEDMPFVYDPISSGGPVTGEILTMYLYLAPGSPEVQVQSYLQDGNYQWHVSNWINLVSGKWTEVSLAVPRISVTALGAQFLVTPANTNATVYLDAVNW